MKSKILICGEAWGEAEEKAQAPFVGLAGKCLDGILDEVGIPRALCHITNVMHERPPGNNFKVFYERGCLPAAYERLRNEIIACQPNVVVCLGNEAMKAVMGFGGVMDWRGSVLTSPGTGVKCVPTIHPAAVLREWTFRPAVVCDFNRILQESEYGDTRRTSRETKINPSLEETLRAIAVAKESDYCSFDIETESGQITCIGLSNRIDWAICIPFWFGSSGSLWSEQDEQLIWVALKELLEADTPKKIAHNGMYELEFLTRTVGIRPKVHFDTMLAFHTLYSELPKTLAYLVSIYTDHPFYKHHRRTDKMDTLWEYNATDAMLTYECAMKIIPELREAGQDMFFETFVQSLVDPLFSMTHRGVRVDTEKKKQMTREHIEALEKDQTDLDALVGHPLNINSHKQMTTWLYDELKLPKRYNDRKATGLKTLSADEDALNELFRVHQIPALEVVLKMRELNKILSTYLNVRLDNDKRIRCTYNIAGTETGRLSSSATAFGTGTNLQNFPDGNIRSLLIPDDGYIFINADLSQAEARVVAHISEDQRLLQVFEEGGDIHKKNASKMFNKPESAVTKDERYLAKRAVHGLNYGMGYKTFARECCIDEATARRVYAIYFATFPRIKVWHMRVRSQLEKSRTLVTPFGRKRIFFNRWNDAMLKEGLAFVPQSTVADIVNQGIVKLTTQEPGDGGKQLLLQVHDSILMQVRPELVGETVEEIREALTHPLEINGKYMTIPVDFKVGNDWGNMEDYSQKENTNVVH